MSDLRSTHVDINTDPRNTGKIIAGIMMAAVIAVTGVFGWQAGWFNGQAVPDHRLPQSSAPLVSPPQ